MQFRRAPQVQGHYAAGRNGPVLASNCWGRSAVSDSQLWCDQEGFSSPARKLFRLFSFPFVPDALNRACTYAVTLSEPFVYHR
jgi:hypothetical protein